LPNARPVVTYTLLAITILVFLAQLASQQLLHVDLPAYYGLKVNQLIAEGQLWRLITPLFLHANLLHIGFNMYALYLIGPPLERYYGHNRFLGLYLLSGFGGNVFSMIFTQAPSLGASTAIFGLIGAQGIFLYQNRQVFGSAARRALYNVIAIAIANLLFGMLDTIDNWGHVGGLIGGLLVAFLGGPLLNVTGIYPDLALSDRRTNTEIIQAHAIVAAFLGLLTAGALYLMK
jgi:rhomboid protease GluP